MQHESVNALEAGSQRLRWQVKDFIVSPWRELPGVYTPTEIFQLRRAGRFLLAAPVLEKLTPNDDVTADSEIQEGNTGRVA